MLLYAGSNSAAVMPLWGKTTNAKSHLGRSEAPKPSQISTIFTPDERCKTTHPHGFAILVYTSSNSAAGMPLWVRPQMRKATSGGQKQHNLREHVQPLRPMFAAKRHIRWASQCYF